MISKAPQYFLSYLKMKPPPSSYKPTPSKAGNVGTSGGDGRPRSNRGIGFSNKLSEKANQL
jgi:hypothetical protein